MIGGMNALDIAIARLDGVGKLAAAIGVGQTVISNWRARGTTPDATSCAAIEKATEGEVTVEVLRPNDRWLRVLDATWPNPAGRPLLDVAFSDSKPNPPQTPDPKAQAATETVAQGVANG